MTLRLLDELGVWVDPEAAWEPVDYEVYDILIRIKQAPRDGAPWRFAGFDLEPAGARLGPARALASFEEVEADEVILRREPGDVWRDTRVLFLPASLKPGRYVLRVGAYPMAGGPRLPAFTVDGARVDNNR